MKKKTQVYTLNTEVVAEVEQQQMKYSRRQLDFAKIILEVQSSYSILFVHKPAELQAFETLYSSSVRFMTAANE